MKNSKNFKIKPNAFIVGFPRSGTTSLFDCLKKHPETHMSKTKEIAYFCKEFNTSEKVRKNWPCPKSKKDYLSYFDTRKRRKIIGEATPFYIFSRIAPGQIYKFNPESKIIIMIRNPRKFLYSLYLKEIESGYGKQENFKDFLIRQTQMKDNSRKKELVYERCNYKKYIENFLKRFPKRNIKIIIFENFINRTEESFENLFSFLGISNTKIYFRKKNKTRKEKDIPKNIEKCIEKYINNTNKFLNDKKLIKEDLNRLWAK